MCDFDDECSGTGILHCLGCGGDLCVCRCGGESECYGCDMCEPTPPGDSCQYDYEEDANG